MKVLPLAQPVISAIPSHANLLAMIMQNESGDAWLSGHYVNIFLRTRKDTTHDYEYNFECHMDNGVVNKDFEDCKTNFIDRGIIDRSYCPLLDYYTIPRLLINNGIIPFIKNLIDKNFYIVAKLNQYYIKASSNYKKYNYDHTVLINGYDDENFFISDFLINYKYATRSITFEDFEKAYSTVTNELVGSHPQNHYQKTELIIVSLNDFNYKYNLNDTIVFLSDYLNGTDSTGRFLNESPWYSSWGDFQMIYGISCTSEIPKLYFKNLLHIKDIHLIYEHKLAMLFRIDYIAKKFSVDLSDIKSKYNDLANRTLVLRNELLKYTVIPREDKEKIAGLLGEYKKVEEDEREILKIFINTLKEI